ncbi:PREDICTED: uncharacterized protein LOC104808577 [Tarenaya hassleriana]|uniref:uncharacterized protein LOC104808577 n=1 Tax=Tarenaya hassleriana TaxID=28532 RepID=UPI00053C4E7A|nr:PREDICTED: uncharacterized protein LOC104808577 [Tarenaya hassleriana]
MEQNRERNFVCKFCSKRFSCGKSLGGHIRTHMNENSVDSNEDEASKLKISDNGGQSSYGLRENPKKNKRFADRTEMNSLKQQQLFLCRECGKGFSALKALCGHMACHSDREKVVMDSQSDTETSSAPIRRRSKRVTKPHKAFVLGDVNQSSSVSFANGNSSSVSEIEQEQEELALCLMMLSKDSSFRKAHNLGNSLGESSDNNSVILETKSLSSGDLKIVNVKDAGEFCCNADEILGAKKLGNHSQSRSAEDNDVLLDDSDNSDSGYFRNGPKKADSDVSVDGFLRNTGSNKAVIESGSVFSNSPAKQDKNLNRLRNAVELRKEWYKEGRTGRSATKYDLRKKGKRVCSNSRKKMKYEFNANGFNESVNDSGENSLEADSCSDTNQNTPGESKIHQGRRSSKATTAAATCSKKPNAKKKSKGHECPICFRVFKSGQALGGHKRSHFIGSHENSTVVIRQEVTEMHHTMIDLNLPAPVDE